MNCEDVTKQRGWGSDLWDSDWQMDGGDLQKRNDFSKFLQIYPGVGSQSGGKEVPSSLPGPGGDAFLKGSLMICF